MGKMIHFKLKRTWISHFSRELSTFFTFLHIYSFFPLIEVTRGCLKVQKLINSFHSVLLRSFNSFKFTFYDTYYVHKRYSSRKTNLDSSIYPCTCTHFHWCRISTYISTHSNATIKWLDHRVHTGSLLPAYQTKS